MGTLDGWKLIERCGSVLIFQVVYYGVFAHWRGRQQEQQKNAEEYVILFCD
jgi:hypothetical protein